MNVRKNEPIRVSRRQRVSAIVVGLLLLLPSLLALAKGGWNYVDYRGLLVFAPGGILLGLVMVVFAARVGR
jgi:hypothetical protein